MKRKRLFPITRASNQVEPICFLQTGGVRAEWDARSQSLIWNAGKSGVILSAAKNLTTRPKAFKSAGAHSKLMVASFADSSTHCLVVICGSPVCGARFFASQTSLRMTAFERWQTFAGQFRKDVGKYKGETARTPKRFAPCLRTRTKRRCKDENKPHVSEKPHDQLLLF